MAEQTYIKIRDPVNYSKMPSLNHNTAQYSMGMVQWWLCICCIALEGSAILVFD